MSALNAFFTYRTAPDTGTTTHRTGTLGDDRVLAARMRAHAELQSGRRWPYGRVAFFAGLSAFLLVTIATAPADADPRNWLTFVGAWLLLGAFVGIAVLLVHRREARRREALGRAVVRDGVCRWCLRDAPHIVEEEEIEPRVYHALEIEREIDRESFGLRP